MIRRPKATFANPAEELSWQQVDRRRFRRGQMGARRLRCEIRARGAVRSGESAAGEVAERLAPSLTGR